MPLRSAYFTDLKGGPTVLFWGDESGMRELRNFLRGPRAASNTLAFRTLCSPVDGKEITIIAVSDAGHAGMRLVRNELEWRLQPELAEDFADMVDVLTSSVSGHQYLDARGNDITVMVSIGEYPESFHPVR
jgi:hypothetical protein